MIPVTRGLPQLTVHDKRRGDFHVTRFAMNLAPVLDKRVLQLHALGQEEGEARRLVAEHVQIHFLADLAMVALFGFFEHLQVFVQLGLGGKSGAVNAGEHLVLGVVLPIRAGNAHELEGFQRLGVAQMRTRTHVRVLALGVKADLSIFGQVVNMLNLVFLAALLHQGNCFGAGKNGGLDGQVFLYNLAHLVFDGGQIFNGQLRVAHIDVVVKSLFRGGAIAEIGFGIQALHGLCHDVRGSVANDFEFLIGRTFVDGAVFVNDLHGNRSFLTNCNPSILPVLPGVFHGDFVQVRYKDAFCRWIIVLPSQ